MESLLSDLAQLERQLQAADERLPVLRQRVDELARRLESVRARPKQETPSEEDSTPREVEFRPPQLRESHKDTSLAFVCRENRLFINDLSALQKAWKADDSQEKGRVLELEAGDFDAKLEGTTIVGIQGSSLVFAPQFEMVVKPGHTGLTVEQLRQPDSQYHACLGKLDPDASMLQFAVFPDGYEIFRSARTIAWERKFDLGWVPRAAGAKVMVGGGAGRVQ